jgi:hypothetical protein
VAQINDLEAVMKNLKKAICSVVCVLSLTSLVMAADTGYSASWSDWTHDEHVLPELYVRSRCVQDPANPKKAHWELQFKDIGDALVEVHGKGFKYNVASNEEAGSAQIKVKSCAALPEVKMGGSVPSKGYQYNLLLKDGALSVQPRERNDWGGWLMAGMMGAAMASSAMAANQAQAAQLRAQEQAQQQAAAAARAEQFAELQARTQAENAAFEQRVAAQRAAQLSQERAQLAAQEAANQRAAQQAAQTAQNRTGGNSSYTGVAPSGYANGSSTLAPQPKDLSISQNYVDQPCNNGSTTAHFELTNASYSNAQMTVEFDYQTGGVAYTFSEVHNLGPRSTNDYTRTIPCGGEPQLSDFGKSYILSFQFF